MAEDGWNKKPPTKSFHIIQPQDNRSHHNFQLTCKRMNCCCYHDRWHWCCTDWYCISITRTLHTCQIQPLLDEAKPGSPEGPHAIVRI